MTRPVQCSLRRSVRFACPIGRAAEPVLDAAPRDNTFASWPSTDRLAVHGEIVIEVDGVADPVTGYLVSVADLDAAVRAVLLPPLASAIATGSSPPLPTLLRDGLAEVREVLRVNVRALTIAMGRYFSITMDADDMTHCTLRQSFEFSAAHRLHCADLDEARNREIFGKCNNPNGHGHNYRLEVAARVRLETGGDRSGDPRPGLREIESAVRQSVIDRLDHRHLNEDIPHFATINPSVENIAAHCRDLLVPALDAIGATLDSLTLWETEKTGCTVRGESPRFPDLQP